MVPTEGQVEISSQQRAALEAAVEADPGAPVFAALAELVRRSQQPAESERIAREGLSRKPEDRDGRLVLSLALIDQGRVDEARQELARLAGDLLAGHAVSFEERDVSDDELDRAFAGAETDTDELIDPNRVAEEAVHQVDGSEPGLAEAASSGPLAPGSTFATATLANLLERQGDARGAERIRRALTPPVPTTPPAAPPAPPAPGERRSRVIATLERWLENLRGERT